MINYEDLFWEQSHKSSYPEAIDKKVTFRDWPNAKICAKHGGLAPLCKKKHASGRGWGVVIVGNVK